ncbi:hypothetical protein F4778DRAFT_795645 [Xylariomycetidae sp. FL2044]|nr:hypothetical protein F4778DRAFT_795645 [Xylariomycetidae sp. FL2044]
MAPNPPTPPDSVAALFKDFDARAAYVEAKAHVESMSSRNFVVEFGPDHARIAFDLGADHFEKLLARERNSTDYPIRWINIWDPSQQNKSTQAIGNYYDFSDRSIKLMSMPPEMDKGNHHSPRRSGLARHRSPREPPSDPEKGEGSSNAVERQPVHSPSASRNGASGTDSDDNVALYRQLKNTVNYFSTDITSKALCIGAHWLHKRQTRKPVRLEDSIMPAKHWQWLAICQDATVLSFHERPLFEPPPEKERAKKPECNNDELKRIRANTLAVLQQLSAISLEEDHGPLTFNSVRKPLQKSNHDACALANEGTSNLFYYLFEDYVAAEPLKMAEHKLEVVTDYVLGNARPKVIVSKPRRIIPILHYLNKDLRELRHLFENYKNLISKIMTFTDSKHLPNDQLNLDPKSVHLAPSALSRFDRLSDRLQFLMLNTIQGYIEETTALSATHFNLTQQKDSSATARLTRSATLLAKLSVFFLPIGFLTSFFSIQIQDLYSNWRGVDFWHLFAVVASVSFVSLFFFSRLLIFFSDVMDEWAAKVAYWGRVFAQKVSQSIGFQREFKDQDKDEDEDE